MKKSELKQMIREEISKEILKEYSFQVIQKDKTSEYVNNGKPVNESRTSNDDLAKLWMKTMKKLKGKERINDEYNKRPYFRINDKELYSTFDAAIEAELKTYTGLKFIGKGRWEEYKCGPGGGRTEVRRALEDKNGEQLNIKLCWGDSWCYGSSSFPYPGYMYVQIYGAVHFRVGAIAFGGGISSDKFEMISSEEKDAMKERITKAIIKNFDRIVE